MWSAVARQGKCEDIRLAHYNRPEHRHFHRLKLAKIKTFISTGQNSGLIILFFKGEVQEKKLVKLIGLCPRLRCFLGCKTSALKLGQSWTRLVTLICDYNRDL